MLSLPPVLLVHLLYASSFLGSCSRRARNRNAVSTHRVSSLILRSILGPKSHRRWTKKSFQVLPGNTPSIQARCMHLTSFIPPLPIQLDLVVVVVKRGGKKKKSCFVTGEQSQYHQSLHLTPLLLANDFFLASSSSAIVLQRKQT